MLNGFGKGIFVQGLKGSMLRVQGFYCLRCSCFVPRCDGSIACGIQCFAFKGSIACGVPASFLAVTVQLTAAFNASRSMFNACGV